MKKLILLAVSIVVSGCSSTKGMSDAEFCNEYSGMYRSAAKMRFYDVPKKKAIIYVDQSISKGSFGSQEKEDMAQNWAYVVINDVYNGDKHHYAKISRDAKMRCMKKFSR